MGVFDFFKKTNKNIDVENEAIVDFNKWEMSHLKWRERLENSVNGKIDNDLDPLIVSCDDKCDLGKWIHGEGKKALSNLEDFQELKKEHLLFHQCAGKIIEKCKNGEVEEGSRMLKKDFDKTSLKVIVLLKQLKKLYQKD